MAYTFRRAAQACLATTSTNAFAFLANGFSTIMPISAFGYFAFIVVAILYINMIFYFPAFLIYFENTVNEKE